jgi:HD-like signal output (HDOD) protein
MTINAHEMVSETLHLVTLPQIYLHVKEIVEDENASLKDLAQCISCDSAITARLLSAANCALWSARSRIESVPRALEVLGMIHVHDLILCTTVASVFEKLDNTHISFEKFWQKSVFNATVASAIGKRAELIDLQRPFLEALLSDIGHMIIYNKVPDLAFKVYQLSGGSIESLVAFEKELIGCEYAEVGAQLATVWQLPLCFSDTIRNQNHPNLSDSHLFETAILHIATRITNKEFENKDIDLCKAIDASVWSSTALSEDCLPDIKQEAQQNIAAILHMFS